MNIGYRKQFVATSLIVVISMLTIGSVTSLTSLDPAEAPAEIVAGIEDGLYFSMSVASTTVSLGQTVTHKMTVRNTSPHNLTIYFVHGLPGSAFDLELRKDAESTRWSDDKFFTCLYDDMDLHPGETFTLPWWWDYSTYDTLPEPGDYLLRGIFYGHWECEGEWYENIYTAFMTIHVLPTAYVASPVLSITPDQIPEQPDQLGHVGDEYALAVNINDAESVWAIQFTVKIAPYVSVLTISDLTEGNFMSYAGTHLTAFTYTTDAFAGEYTIVISRLPDPMYHTRMGASGHGTLVTMQVNVVEAGETPITLIDTILLDPEGNAISHAVSGGFYSGSTASLIRVNLPDGRKVRAEGNFTINAKVRNDGDVPLFTRVRFDIARVEDGRRVVLRSGQEYFGGGLGEPPPSEYVYANEFDEWIYDWDYLGTNALGPPDGLYIESDAHCQMAGNYGFEDISLSSREIQELVLEGYTQYPNGFTESVDIDVYGFSSVQSFVWLGSLWGTAAWGGHGVRWTSENILEKMPELAAVEEFNDFEILLHNYYGNSPDIVRVDAIRLKVGLANIIPVVPPVYLVNPGEELELGPVLWHANFDHLGSYEITATIEYTSDYFKWNSWGSRQKTLVFWIVPP